MLEAIKSALGITGTYQDATIQQYINEVINFLIEGGVSADIVNSESSYGLIARGVADLWNYGSGGTSLSPYFIQRATQLALKSPSKAAGDLDYNELDNKPQIEGVTLINNKSLNDFGVEKMTNSEIEKLIKED